jgi:signal transduction histidine kinase
MAKYKRRKKLINPRLQLWMTSVFLGLTALSLLMQLMLFMLMMSHVALTLPNDGDLMWDQINERLYFVIGASFFVFLPLTLLVGILTTFRVAGPVFVFHRFLKNIREGRDPGVMRLRSGDKLTDLADALNETYAVIKERESKTTDAPNHSTASDSENDVQAA